MRNFLCTSNTQAKRFLAFCLAFILTFTLFAAALPPASAATATITLSNSMSTGTKDGYTVTAGGSSANQYYVITITDPGTYTLTGTLPGASSSTKAGHILVQADCTLILDGVTIQAGAYTQSSVYTSYGSRNVGTAAISVQGNTNCTIQLAAGKTNTITGYTNSTPMLNSAGIYVENTIGTSGTKSLASVTIENQTEGFNGTLVVTGGNQCAAIGGNVNRATGNIIINSGKITANAGSWATGIGDGDSDKTATSTNSSTSDLITWSCADPNGSGRDSDGDGYSDTCQPAKITINGGDILARGQNAAPGIGTSDELSGTKDTKSTDTGLSGSGVANRIWKGQTIEINGGTIVSIGGASTNSNKGSLTSVGAGLYTILSPGSIEINKGEGDNQTKFLGISLSAGYTINNSGMTFDQNSPDISADSTANVFSFKYTDAGIPAASIIFSKWLEESSNYVPITDFPQDILNTIDLGINSATKVTNTVSGLAVVLPDGTYKVSYNDDTLAEAVLEGGGMVYGDATNPAFTVRIKVRLDGAEWTDSGKTFALRKGNTGSYLTSLAVSNGEYRIYEIAGDGTYIDTSVDVTVSNQTASATVDYYTVSYEDEDGTVYNSQSVIKNGNATPPTDNPEKTGYTFKKWKGTQTKITAPTKIVAEWGANSYTVRFNSNYPSGTNSYTEQTLTYDLEGNLNPNTFAIDGYAFKGWATSDVSVYDHSADSTITWSYLDKATVKNLASEGTYHLYAVWEKGNDMEITVSVDNNYIDEATQEPAVAYPNDRAKETVVTLWRRIAGSGDDADYEEVTTQTVTFADYATEAEYFGSHTFTGYPVTDGEGNVYEYMATTEKSNYTPSIDDQDWTKLFLEYAPICFDVPFKVTPTFTNTAIFPEAIHVKVVYRLEGEDTSAESAPVISQHVTTYVTATWNEDVKAYTGSYPVWKWRTESGGSTTLYDYHVRIVSYVVGGETVSAANSAYTAAYDEDTWVTYDKDNNTADGTILATLGVKCFDIIYQENGGTMPSGCANEYTCGTGLSTLPEPTKDCYDFVHWCSDEDLTKKVECISDTAYGDVTLYAKWTPKEYTVAYDTGDKGEDIDDGSYTYGTGINNLPTPDSTVEGYIFEGWYTEENGGGDKVESITNTDNGNQTLYANWRTINYRVEFLKNNMHATGNMSSQTFSYDEEKALSAMDFTAPGFEFLGWALTPDASSALYEDNEIVSNLAVTEDAVVRLYAVWDIKGSITINNAYNGATNTAEAPTSVTVTLMRRHQDDEFFTEHESVEVPLEQLETFVTDYQFQGIPTSDENLKMYEYKVVVTLDNYDVSYDENNIFAVTLNFNPNTFVVPFEIDASVLDAASRPEKIYVRILYRSHGEDISADDPNATIIIQHSVDYITAELVGDKYIGSYSVWTLDNSVPQQPYDYHIRIAAYVVNGEVMQPENTDYAVSNFSDWVYYDSDSQAASGIMKAKLSMETYKVVLIVNDGTGEQEIEYVVGEGLIELPTPEREGYEFGGWYDEDGNRIETITGLDLGNIILYAHWIPLSSGNTDSDDRTTNTDTSPSDPSVTNPSNNPSTGDALPLSLFGLMGAGALFLSLLVRKVSKNKHC